MKKTFLKGNSDNKVFVERKNIKNISKTGILKENKKFEKEISKKI